MSNLKPLRERVKESLLYKPIKIKTRLVNGNEVEGESITVTDENLLSEVEKILTKEEKLTFLRQGINILINNQDRNALKPQNKPIDRLKKLISEGKITIEEIAKLLQ